MIKLLLAGIVLSTSAMAFHPDDNDRLMDIGINTELTVISDLNVIPNSDTLSLGNGCKLKLHYAKKFDRVLAAGTILKVIDSDKEKYYSTSTHYLYVNNANISYISCVKGDYQDPTIGQLRGTKAFDIKLADPQKI